MFSVRKPVKRNESSGRRPSASTRSFDPTMSSTSSTLVARGETFRVVASVGEPPLAGSAVVDCKCLGGLRSGSGAPKAFRNRMRRFFTPPQGQHGPRAATPRRVACERRMRRGRTRLRCLALGSVLAAVLLAAAAATGTAVVPGSAHVAGVASATAVSTAGDHACALFTGGTVRCWGQNDQGQLGDGTRTSRLTPVAVRGLSGVIQVSAAQGYTCALIDAGGGSGPVKCWGAPSSWSGVGQSHGTLVPVTIGGVTDAIDVSAGGGLACALLSDRTVECWGDNSRGELGDGTRGSSTTPVVVPGLSGVQAIDAGDRTVCVVMQSAGAVRCWGSAGYVVPDVPLDTLSPAAVPGVTGAVSVTASPNNACALLQAGTVQCWAMSSHPFTAAVVPGLSGVKAFAFSFDGEQTEHTCVLLAGGGVECRSPNPTWARMATAARARMATNWSPCAACMTLRRSAPRTSTPAL